MATSFFTDFTARRDERQLLTSVTKDCVGTGLVAPVRWRDALGENEGFFFGWRKRRCYVEMKRATFTFIHELSMPGNHCRWQSVRTPAAPRYLEALGEAEIEVTPQVLARIS